MEVRDYLKRFVTACDVCENNRWVLGALSRMTFAVLLLSASLSASTIIISASGTFTNLTASSPFSGPDETWSFSFDVDSQPAVSNVNPGNYFDVAFSDFSYFLDGSPVAITPVDIRFFNTSQLGGFNICFTVACSFFNSPTDGFEIQTPQMFKGSESAPTMSTGTFTSPYMDLYVDSNDYFEVYGGRPVQTVTAAVVATPEPSTILILGAGFLLALAGRRLRRRT